MVKDKPQVIGRELPKIGNTTENTTIGVWKIRGYYAMLCLETQ